MSPEGRFNTGEQATPAWAERAVICCDMLAPAMARREVNSVADVGCGDQKLKRVLQVLGWAVGYQGFDLIPQADDVQRLDLNVETPPNSADAVVILGVLEYVDDVAACLRRLAGCFPLMVVSHLVRDGEKYSDSEIRRRGWANHMYAEDFAKQLTENGWHIVESRTTSDLKTHIWLAEQDRLSA